MSLPNTTKPIFVVFYVFMLNPADELRIVNWTPALAEQDLPFRYAAQIESNSIEEFLTDEVQVKVAIKRTVKPKANVSTGSNTDGVTLYNDINFQIENLAISYTYMYENDLGIFYAVTVLDNNVFIPRIGKAKSSVVYDLETVEQSGSDKPYFEENKQSLLNFFKENENKLRANFERRRLT